MMKFQAGFALALVAFLGIQTVVFAAPLTAQDKADIKQINSACAQDAKNTGCTGKTMGKGLLKCMKKYKKTNKSYKFSDGCKSALKKFRSDRKAGK